MRQTMVVLAVLAAICAYAVSAHAVGVGVMVGEPTGLAFQFGGRGDNAVNAAVGWSISEEEWFYVHADYIFLSLVRSREFDETIPFYYGIGARAVLLEDDSRMGVRAPLGLQYETGDLPVTFFIEVAPLFDLAPETEFGVAGGIGVRFGL